MRYGLAHLFAFMVGLCLLLVTPAIGQEFPYQAPKAPEFDSSGKYVTPGARGISANNQQSRPVRRTAARPDPKPQPRSQPRPISSTPPRGMYASNNVPASPQPRATAVSNRAPQPVQPQVQRKPDCSEYPMRIANAKTKAEMQQIARYYLGCLVNNGWPQESARQQVITTIQGVYGR